MKKLIFLSAIFTLLLANAISLKATSFQGNKNITISEEVNEDLYLAGENITIDAAIRGDLICAGSDILIRDSVTEDAILAGGKLQINGVIGDDLRVAGGTIMIDTDVFGDLVIAGGKVTLSKDAVIHGNLQMVGGKLYVNGNVMGKANVRGGEVYWNGVAEKELMVKSGELVLNGTVMGTAKLGAENISIGSNARFNDHVEYWNDAGELAFADALAGGVSAVYNPDLKIGVTDTNWQYLGVGVFAFWVYRLLVSAVIIGLLIWMFHRFFSRTSEETSRHYGKHLGYGILYVIGIPILIVVAFATIIGIPVGFIMALGYGLTIALGHILASILIAYGLNTYYDKNWSRGNLILIAICSYFALKLLGAIPFLGFLVSIIVVTTAFGTLLYIWRESRTDRSRVMVE